MTRGPREEVVASVAIGCLQEAAGLRDPAGESLLVALDETGHVAQAADELGYRCTTWCRAGTPDAAPWPGPLRVRTATLRVPKGREALEMSLHAVLARLEPGGRIFVYGANDEGIRSAGRLLEQHLDHTSTLETKRHARVWVGELPAKPGPLRGDLSEWEQALVLDAPGGPLPLVSFPGLFAHGRLDPGTRLLLETLLERPLPKEGASVLDYGCGAGTVTLALARRERALDLHGVDRDALALHAAHENLAEAHWHLGDGWKALPPDLSFDLVVSNPPLHLGKEQDLRPLQAFVEGAPARLTRRGRLILVTQRPLPLGAMLDERFQEVEVVRESAGYRVWAARRPSRARPTRRRGRGQRVEPARAEPPAC